MRVGLTLAGDLLDADDARFAAVLGANDVVVRLTHRAGNTDEPIPDGMASNMRCRNVRAVTPPVRYGCGARGSAHLFRERADARRRRGRRLRG